MTPLTNAKELHLIGIKTETGKQRYLQEIPADEDILLLTTQKILFGILVFPRKIDTQGRDGAQINK